MTLLRRSALLLTLLAFSCQKESPAAKNVPAPSVPTASPQALEEISIPSGKTVATDAAPKVNPVDVDPVAVAKRRAALEGSLTADPANVSALRELSDLLYAERKELDRSDDLLMTALEGNLPGGVDFILGRTVAYARRGDAARGLSLLDRALTAKPKEPRLLLLRGRYLLQRHQCERALGDFEGAVRFDPKNAAAHASVGLARLCIGDGDDAAQSFRRSLAIDPDQPEIRRALAGIAGP